MKRVFGRQTRFSFGGARKMCVPALATQPVPMVVTFAAMNLITSWMASPDSTWPPGEEISMLIGASDSSASAIKRVQAARATACVISPNTITNRDLNARRSAIASTRSGASGFSSLASMASPQGVDSDGTTARRPPFDSASCKMDCRPAAAVIFFSGHGGEALWPGVRPRADEASVHGAYAPRHAAEDPGVPARAAPELRARWRKLPPGGRGAEEPARPLHRGRDAGRGGALGARRAAARARHARGAGLRPRGCALQEEWPLGRHLQDQWHRTTLARSGVSQPARARHVLLPRVLQRPRAQDAARVFGAVRPAAHRSRDLGERHQELLAGQREARPASPLQAAERPPAEERNAP